MQTVGHIQRLFAVIGMVLMWGVTAAFSQTPNLEIDDRPVNSVGQIVTFTVSITNAPNEVGAFGFEITFDQALLRFQTLTMGTLTSDLAADVMDANVVSPGTLRVGGFLIREPQVGGPTFRPIAAGDNGSLLQLTFTVLELPTAPSTLTITNLVDDIGQTGWVLGSGQAIPSPERICDVDNNGVSDVLTDAIMMARFLVDFPIDMVIAGAVAPDCRRCTAPEIEAFLQQIRPRLDVDDNGTPDTLTDIIMMARFLVDLPIGNAVAPDCRRCTVPEVESYLRMLCQ